MKRYPQARDVAVTPVDPWSNANRPPAVAPLAADVEPDIATDRTCCVPECGTIVQPERGPQVRGRLCQEHARVVYFGYSRRRTADEISEVQRIVAAVEAAKSGLGSGLGDRDGARE